MATATGRLISLDEFARLADEPGKQELSDGELITGPPAKAVPNKLSRLLYDALHASLAASGVGEVWFEAGFQLGPCTVRQPDVAVVPDTPLRLITNGHTARPILPSKFSLPAIPPKTSS